MGYSCDIYKYKSSFMSSSQTYLAKFLSSLIRQVGRDTGKVISNKLYGDAHATPYRRAGNLSSSKIHDTIPSISEGRRKTYEQLSSLIGETPSDKMTSQSPGFYKLSYEERGKILEKEWQQERKEATKRVIGCFATLLLVVIFVVIVWVLTLIG